MKRLSVLGIVSYNIFPAQMGEQKGVAGFYRQLALHADVTLAVSRDNDPAAAGFGDIRPFLFNNRSASLNIFHLRRLRKLIAQKHVDVIIIEHSFFGLLGAMLQRMTHKPFVIHSHNIEALRFRDMGRSWWWLYARYERSVHLKAAHSFFVTADDMQWAIDNWQLSPSKCSVVTYGADMAEPLPPQEKAIARKRLADQYGLSPDTRLFLFNGTLDYVPNTDALRIIVSELLPLLRKQDVPFKIFVCGKNLSNEWQQVLKRQPEIIYTGYVDDLDPYWYGADCFINPVTLGGGIRTKLVEALSRGLTVISTATGAKGIPADASGQKLQLVADYEWASFAQVMMQQELHVFEATPRAFQNSFHWEPIVRKALLSLQAL